jgi:hypothetical protein
VAFNKSGGKDVALSVFGGLVTEMAAPDLPEGVSPACQDVAFVPGSAFSRPGLAKYFATALSAGGPLDLVPTVTYGKTFITPLGVIYNLWLDSNGLLYYENVSTAPGVVNVLAAVQPGSYAKSVTAFGREYIAISDTQHGSDVPLQWDGTNLDRVTQDGPGAPPVVASVTLPPVEMEASSLSPVTPVEADPATLVGGQYTQINLFTSSSVAGLLVGQQITIAGYTGGTHTAMNGTWTILTIYPGSPNSLIVVSAILPSTTVYSTQTSGVTWVVVTGFTMQRANNVVTVTTSEPHNLQPGFQAQITGIPTAAVGGGIASVVIDNEDLPGEATVTTNDPHGLLPGCLVSLTGISGVAVGTAITSAVWNGGLVTVTTSAAHGLAPGANITIATTGDTPAGYFDGTWTVIDTPTTTTFTYVYSPVTAPTASATGGTVKLNWPIPDEPDPTYYEVITAPTPTSFTVQITYCDSTFASGTVSFPWNGTFFVLAVPASDVFQYTQYGPDATTTTTGEVTPYGQAAPGIHQCRVSFLTRNGFITESSATVTFVANGGQYVSLTQLPVASSAAVVARVVQFTGAGGAYFFYIPTPAQINGQQVSTATQINDNETTAVLLDFSDNTLFAAEGVSIPGNDIAAQSPIDGALGFGFYASRLLTWGQRNRIDNLLNMGFAGGYGFVKSGQMWIPTDAGVPLGWTSPTGMGGSILQNGHFGTVLDFEAAGNSYTTIEQSAYLDAYGSPISTPNAQYRLRLWCRADVLSNNFNLLAVFSSTSTGFSSSAEILGSAMTAAAVGAYLESLFNNPMPAAIPSDMVFALIFTNTTAAPYTMQLNEVSVLYATNPYTDTVFNVSYDQNPEAFDGVTGVMGSDEDTRKIMDLGGIIRETLYFLTEEPSGRLHQTADNGVTEPSGWTVSQAAANCGVLSAFAVTRSQADDATASGGEEWFAWASTSGARMFGGGGDPGKISQEIQPNWQQFAAPYQQTAWALNDYVNRVLYFGLCVGGNTAPSVVYQCSYRELDTAYQIITSGPIHTSFTGRLIATDHTRKWAPWNVIANGAAIMYSGPNAAQVIFFGGNGQTPGAAAGHGNVYSLSAAKLTDDDYGQIYPFYTTYFFVSHDAEQALFAPNGGGRKLLQYVQAYVSGVGNLTLTFFPDRLGNPWALTVTRTLSLTPNYDLECAGGNAQGQRIAIQFSVLPATGTDVSFNLEKVIANLKLVTHLPIRGSV